MKFETVLADQIKEKLKEATEDLLFKREQDPEKLREGVERVLRELLEHSKRYSFSVQVTANPDKPGDMLATIEASPEVFKIWQERGLPMETPREFLERKKQEEIMSKDSQMNKNESQRSMLGWPICNFEVIDMDDGTWAVVAAGKVIERNIPTQDEAIQRARTSWLRGEVEYRVDLELSQVVARLSHQWEKAKTLESYTLRELESDVREAVTTFLEKQLWKIMTTEVADEPSS